MFNREQHQLPNNNATSVPTASPAEAHDLRRFSLPTWKEIKHTAEVYDLSFDDSPKKTNSWREEFLDFGRSALQRASSIVTVNGIALVGEGAGVTTLGVMAFSASGITVGLALTAAGAAIAIGSWRLANYCYNLRNASTEASDAKKLS